MWLTKYEDLLLQSVLDGLGDPGSICQEVVRELESNSAELGRLDPRHAPVQLVHHVREVREMERMMPSLDVLGREENWSGVFMAVAHKSDGSQADKSYCTAHHP